MASITTLDLLRHIQSNAILVFGNEQATAESVKKLTGELFSQLKSSAAEIDSRITIPPVQWREGISPDYAFLAATHDRKTWIELVESRLSDAVFLEDVPRGWQGTLPGWSLRESSGFVDWLREAVETVQGFQSSPDDEHKDRKLRIAQQLCNNASRWLSMRLNHAMQETPTTLNDCERFLVNTFARISTLPPDPKPYDINSNEWLISWIPTATAQTMFPAMQGYKPGKGGLSQAWSEFAKKLESAGLLFRRKQGKEVQLHLSVEHLYDAKIPASLKPKQAISQA